MAGLRLGCLVLLITILYSAGAVAKSGSDYVREHLQSSAPIDLDANCKEASTPDCRTVAADLIRKLLTEHDTKLPPAGLSVENAVIEGNLNLSHVKLDAAVAITNSHFRNKVDMGYADLLGLDLSDSEFLNASNEFDQGLSLIYARIAKYLFLGGIKIPGTRATFNLNSIDVSGVMLLRGAQIAPMADLVGAHVGMDIDMSGAVFGSDLTMSELTLDHNLFLGNPEVQACDNRLGTAEFHGAVDARNIVLRRQLTIGRAEFDHGIDLHGSQIGTQMFVTNCAVVHGLLNLQGVSIKDSLHLANTTLSAVDLTGAKIDNELWLEQNGEGPKWIGAPSRMVLANAHVRTIRDTLGGWPDCLTLDGFTYDHPPKVYAGDKPEAFKWTGRACAAVQSDIAPHEDYEPRPAEWWQNWLARDPKASSQPYAELAIALRGQGNTEEAASVLWSMREHEVGLHPLSLATFLFLFGFGIGFYALIAGLIWVAILTVIGWFLINGGDPNRAHPGSWRWIASLQNALPILTPSEAYRTDLDACLTGRRRDAFAILSLFGYVAGFFLLAGLTGLTDK